jgi:hypothetical protein
MGAAACSCRFEDGNDAALVRIARLRAALLAFRGGGYGACPAGRGLKSTIRMTAAQSQGWWRGIRLAIREPAAICIRHLAIFRLRRRAQIPHHEPHPQGVSACAATIVAAITDTRAARAGPVKRSAPRPRQPPSDPRSHSRPSRQAASVRNHEWNSPTNAVPTPHGFCIPQAYVHLQNGHPCAGFEGVLS